jgi:hypothetical protein
VLASLDDGSPCIVTSDFGKGHTMYAGSFLAMSNSRGSQWDQSTQRITVQDSSYRNINKFLMGMAEWAKVVSPFSSSMPENAQNPLVIRMHEYPGGYLIYVLNHGRTTEKTTIKLEVPEKGTWVLKEMLGNRLLKQKDSGNKLEFTTGDIAEKGAEIWNITRQ